MSFHNVLGAPWADRTVFLIGGGPSLKGFDFSRIQDEFRLGINKSALVLNTDAVFSLDRVWINENIPKLKAFQGEKILGIPANYLQLYSSQLPDAKYLNRVRHAGISVRNDEVHGSNSGYGGLDVIIKYGCTDIAMLGMDMTFRTETHWHGGYARKDTARNGRFSRWKDDFYRVREQADELGIMITNLNPDSKIEAFIKKDFETYYHELSERRQRMGHDRLLG